jgi:hypothetical protein
LDLHGCHEGGLYLLLLRLDLGLVVGDRPLVTFRILAHESGEVNDGATKVDGVLAIIDLQSRLCDFNPTSHRV